MKKTVIFILIISMLSLFGCRSVNENGCAKILANSLGKENIPGDYLIYTDCRDISLVGYIGSEKLNYLYYGEKQPLQELSLVVCFSVGINKSKECSEIHMYKVKNTSDSFAIERMLKTRAEFLIKTQINQNSSAFFAENPSEYEIITRDNYVILFVGKDAKNTVGKIADNI